MWWCASRLTTMAHAWLWVKSEGPTLIQQPLGHQYQTLFSISGWELLTGAGHDPKERVESVPYDMQDHCREERGLENHFYLPERERSPACKPLHTHCHGLGLPAVCCATGFAFLRATTLEVMDSPSSSSSPSWSSAGERVRWSRWWALWESGDCVTIRERCKAVV